MSTSALRVGQEVELITPLPQHGLRPGARGVVVRELGYWDLVVVRFGEREVRVAKAKLRPITAEEQRPAS